MSKPKVPARERMEQEALFTFKKHPRPEICCVKGCRTEAGHAKKRVGGYWFCHAHWQARWKFTRPKNAAYRNLQDSAKRRGLSFTLTYDYFLGMMDCAAAWDREAESRGEMVSIDRIEAHKGYEQGNIRVISLSENVIKGNKERYLPDYVQSLLARKRAKVGAKLGEEIEGEEGFPF